MKRNDQKKALQPAVCIRHPFNRLAAGIVSIIAAFALMFAMTGSAWAASATGDAEVVPAAQTGAFGPTKANVLTSGTFPAHKAATVLVYLNGSDLESYAGEATADIAEMIESGIGGNANVVIETLGTKEWQDYGIASDHTQRYVVNQGELQLVDDSLGQLDTTDPATLADFISWGTQNYPADRYMLIMWDHGAGPVYGFGYDEFQSEESALTLDEIQEALEANADVHFDFIGMDCCIMSSLETYYVLAPFCDYAILSEDFEPGIGWSYANWMRMLEQNPSTSTVELGTAIVDDMVAAAAEDPENGDATLALVDESAVPALYDAWVNFAYENKESLLGTNYSQEVSQHGREGLDGGTARPGGHGDYGSHGGYGVYGSHEGHGSGHGMGAYGGMEGYGFGGFEQGYGQGDYYGYGYDDDSSYGYGYGYADDYSYGNDYGYGHGYDDDYGFAPYSYGWEGCEEGACPFDLWDDDLSYVTMTDYFVTDIMTVASAVDSDKAAALEAAMDNAIVHYSCTEGDADMAGIGVTLPYGDGEFYDELVKVFSSCEIDSAYLAWLEDFVDAEGAMNAR